MNNILSFGESEGKIFEWLFFNRPWYAEWLYGKGIHHQRHNFREEADDYFEELFTRASCLTGTCPYCKERPITYMGLSRLCTGTLGHVDFFCEECNYTAGQRLDITRPRSLCHTTHPDVIGYDSRSWLRVDSSGTGG